MSEIRVRFAPSPTGALHLGGARTALFNWLHARHTGGRFLLRIEDTDRERSTEESKQAIFEALSWLGMDWDEEPVLQSERLADHQQALQQLIDAGRVYKCYCTPEERAAAREEAEQAKRPYLYDGRCDGKPDRTDVPFVWRFRMPKDGETVVDDIVQGSVVTPNEEIEDLVIARADGSPLYNFVVVVDDAAMGVTHVVRGKDHLTNTAKQVHIYEALGLPLPRFAHLPLILKLSKRLRSAGVETYRDQGYLPEAVNNYIARLGWSHGDQEVFAPAELVEKFDLADVGRSEGALNLEKMLDLNHKHIMGKSHEELAALVVPFLEGLGAPVPADHPRLVGACRTRREKAKTLVQLAEEIRFYFLADDEIEHEPKAAKKFLGEENRARLGELAGALEGLDPWDEEHLETALKGFASEREIGFGKVAGPARVALVGGKDGPGIWEAMAVLGKVSTVARLRRAADAGGA